MFIWIIFYAMECVKIKSLALAGFGLTVLACYEKKIQPGNVLGQLTKASSGPFVAARATENLSRMRVYQLTRPGVKVPLNGVEMIPRNPGLSRTKEVLTVIFFQGIK